MNNDFQVCNQTISVKSTKWSDASAKLLIEILSTIFVTSRKWSHVCNKPAGGAQ